MGEVDPASRSAFPAGKIEPSSGRVIFGDRRLGSNAAETAFSSFVAAYEASIATKEEIPENHPPERWLHGDLPRFFVIPAQAGISP